MTEKFTAITLDITRHNDRHNIVTLYTRTRGRIVFLSPNGSGKAGRMRRSRLQPLSVIEGDFRFNQTSELQKLPAFSLHEVWTDIYFHPIKQMLVLFLSEFLTRLLRASMPDENLWDFIFNALRLLDQMKEGLADYHIAFLSSLLPFMGIQPDGSGYTEGMAFDMQAGVFTSTLPPHGDVLTGEEARLASVVSRIDFTNFRALRLNGELRSRILRTLLRYYSIHFPGVGNLKSLDVIHDIFH